MTPPFPDGTVVREYLEWWNELDGAWEPLHPIRTGCYDESGNVNWTDWDPIELEGQ